MNEKWLSKHLRDQWQQVKLRSFESALSFSVPDLHAVFGKGLTAWIELKVCESIHCCIPFRHGQVQWIEQYQRDGGIVYLIVATKAQGRRELFVLPCSNVRIWSEKKLEQTPAIYVAPVQLAAARGAETAIMTDFYDQINSVGRYRRRTRK